MSLPLPFDMPPVRLFSFADRTCPIDAYGATSDGTTLNTVAIASAIDDCAKLGGGTVAIPRGRWLTGPIHLKSNIRLDLAEGAELLFSQRFDDYLPAVFSRYEGMEYYNYSPLIYAIDCHDIAITGKGLINGQGQPWWRWKSWQQKGAKKLYALADANIPAEERVFGTVDDGLRPSLIQFVRCSRILLEEFSITDGPMWTIHPVYSDNIVIRGVTVTTNGPNNDGIVIDSSRNVIVDNVHLNTSDDAIAIKSGLDKGGQRVGIPSENIIIKDCAVGRGNGGVVIGSEMSGGVRNVLVSGCAFDGTKRGIRIKSTPGRGGIVENVWVKDVTMKNIVAEAIFLNMFYDSKNVIQPRDTSPSTFQNFFFENIECSWANDAVVAIGSDNSFIQNLVLKNIRTWSRNGILLQHVDGVHLEHSDIRAKDTPLMSLYNIRHAAFDSLEKMPAYRPFISVFGKDSEDIRLDSSYPKKAVRLGKEVTPTAVSRENKE